MTNEEKERTCGLNYEAEYVRLREINKTLKEEAAYWREQCVGAERKLGNMKWVLRTIEVIFGREFGE